MAGIKISALPAIPSSQISDIGAFVQGGITYKASISQVSTLLSSILTLNSISQVTGLPAALSGFLPLSGGTMSGNLILNGNATLPNQAVTFSQLQTVAGGFTVILAAQAATTANLNATPAGAGVGATLTNAGAMAAFAVDGYSASLNDRILVKNQTLTQHNGIYTVTTVGSGAANWVLTRATDYDQATEIKPGTLVAVNNGTANANTSWLETATVVTVDTDPVLFSQFTFAPASFLQVANNLSDVANAATSRTNLGLGTAATKTASDNTKTNAAMVNGATTIGHIAVFSDVNGTIQDGGAAAGTVTNIATSGLATGGPITNTGTITVLAATQAEQEAAAVNTSAVTPAVQKFHPGSAKAWARFQGNPVVIKASYNITSIVRNSAGVWTVTLTTAFSGANNYCVQVGSSNNSGNTNGCVAFNYTASTFQIQAEDGTGPVDAVNVNLVAFGDQ